MIPKTRIILTSLSLCHFVVLGSEFIAQRDIVRITLSPPWMLLNAMRAIIAGWGFQLNGTVTGKLCRASVDFLQFGINSIPHRNRVLFFAVIPKATESETVYQIAWDDLRGGVLDMLKYKDSAVLFWSSSSTPKFKP